MDTIVTAYCFRLKVCVMWEYVYQIDRTTDQSDSIELSATNSLFMVFVPSL